MLGQKDLLYRKRKLFSCGTQLEIWSKPDSDILHAQVANHIAGFGSTWSLNEQARHITNSVLTYL